MDDNAPCHRTVAAEQLFESEDIERMDWPARSPDLNPIEHVWDFLGRRLAARTLPPVTIRELRLALQDEWAAMPQQLIDTLILSMGRRCETCLAVREIISPTKDRMFLAGHPSQGFFGLQSHCAPCYFFNQASFYPSDFSFNAQLMPSVVNSDFEVKNQGSSQGLVSARSAEVKLPTLSLPIFSGVTEEWLAFSDLLKLQFPTINDLTGAQKLQYLKGSLKSDALKIVNSLSITNDNFEIAWKLLKDRYFNKREIMSFLIKKFINITPLSGESSTQILNLIDSTKEFVRMLESFEYQVDPTSDTLLMHMIYCLSSIQITELGLREPFQQMSSQG
ncbi:transposable element Tcb2 transposase [Trichonephila clavipes]|nr:transposable element Tcb2 transposase [Trichonephila clavipes]